MVLYRGEDFVFDVEIVDEDYNPIDITNWEFYSALKKVPYWEDAKEPPIVSLSVGSGITIVDATQGKLSVMLSKDITKTLELYQTYYLDLVAITDEGIRKVLNLWEIYVDGSTTQYGLV